MRHQNTGNKLSRHTAHRSSMLRNLVTSLFEHGRVETTRAKAKAARPVAEKLVTLAKRGDLHARRQAASYVRSPETVRHLFDYWAGLYGDRNGGYTRIIRGGFRHGDGAELALLELIGPDGGTAAPPRPRDTTPAA
jgi:large subunit ribosomal protein L17